MNSCGAFFDAENARKQLADLETKTNDPKFWDDQSKAQATLQERKKIEDRVNAEAALDRLTSWQRSTHKIVTLHHAYIAGENDAEDDVHAICDALEARRLTVHVNIVRYNPHDPVRHGVEPPEEVIERNAAIYRSRLANASVSVIARVGYDVAASCGMFFGPAGPATEAKNHPPLV